MLSGLDPDVTVRSEVTPVARSRYPRHQTTQGDRLSVQTPAVSVTTEHNIRSIVLLGTCADHREQVLGRRFYPRHAV